MLVFLIASLHKLSACAVARPLLVFFRNHYNNLTIIKDLLIHVSSCFRSITRIQILHKAPTLHAYLSSSQDGSNTIMLKIKDIFSKKQAPSIPRAFALVTNRKRRSLYDCDSESPPPSSRRSSFCPLPFSYFSFWQRWVIVTSSIQSLLYLGSMA